MEQLKQVKDQIEQIQIKLEEKENCELYLKLLTELRAFSINFLNLWEEQTNTLVVLDQKDKIWKTSNNVALRLFSSCVQMINEIEQVFVNLKFEPNSVEKGVCEHHLTLILVRIDLILVQIIDFVLEAEAAWKNTSAR